MLESVLHIAFKKGSYSCCHVQKEGAFSLMPDAERGIQIAMPCVAEIVARNKKERRPSERQTSVCICKSGQKTLGKVIKLLMTGCNIMHVARIRFLP